MEFYTNVQRVGNRIWLRHFDESGRDCQTFIKDFCPTLYVKSNGESDKQTIFGESLKPIQTESLKHAREMIKEYEGVSGFQLYGNTNWEYSYLFNRYGNRLPYDFNKIKVDILDIETAVGENSTGFPKPFYAAERITLMTIRRKDEYHVFAYKEFDISKLNTIGLKIRKHMFNSEDAMLRGYLAFHENDYPMVLCGFHSEGFDVPYLINRIKQRLGEDAVNRLSPLGMVTLQFAEDDESIVKRVILKGIEHLDYLAMYKKFIPGERDFKLDAISEDHLNEKKVENPFSSFVEFYDGTGDITTEDMAERDEISAMAYKRFLMKEKFRAADVKVPVENDYSDHGGGSTPYDDDFAAYWKLDAEIKQAAWDLFTWYNVRDVDLVFRLEGALGLLNLAFTLAYLVGMNYSDAFATVKPWDIFLQNEMYKKGKFVSVKETRGEMPRNLMGGFVHLYEAGLKKDGVTIDATSLYPSIMMMMNIGPETKVQEEDIPSELIKYFDKLHIEEWLKDGVPAELTELLVKNKFCMTPNGQFYRTDKQGIIAETVSGVFKDRKAEKNLMLGFESDIEAIDTEIKELEKLLEAA